MTAPRPGSPVRGSQTGRPLMAALDLLGRRWALRILWELRDGPVGPRELRARCDAMSPSVLYQRLRELIEAGLVAKDAADRYALTPLGADLGEAIAPLERWSRRWARRVQAGETEPVA
jgi:DNA-binding HxlR family transcriptional regulator